MIMLIYGSVAAQRMTDADLLEILLTAKEKNDELGITGMLLYKDENFLQVLEGEEEVVEDLYSKIAKDPRHHSVMTIFKRPIKEREFADWKMGFVNLDSLETDNIEGFSDYLEQPIGSRDFSDKPSYAFTFLKYFKDLVR